MNGVAVISVSSSHHRQRFIGGAGHARPSVSGPRCSFMDA